MDKAAELIRERDRRVSIAFWLSILFCPFIPKGLALGYYHRQTLGTHILLWLRKFHGNKRSTLTLAEALSMACRGLGVCVTLRDSVVGSNPHKPVSLILLNIYLCLLLGLPWLFVVIAFDDIS